MTCLRCDSSGYTVVGTHEHCGATYEEYGPCDCEAGKLVEFPPPSEKGKPRVGPWGNDGYWRGRPNHLPPPESKVYLSKEENARRARELLSNRAARAMP